jgi:hypothetical protein
MTVRIETGTAKRDTSFAYVVKELYKATFIYSFWKIISSEVR